MKVIVYDGNVYCEPYYEGTPPYEEDQKGSACILYKCAKDIKQHFELSYNIRVIESVADIYKRFIRKAGRNPFKAYERDKTFCTCGEAWGNHVRELRTDKIGIRVDFGDRINTVVCSCKVKIEYIPFTKIPRITVVGMEWR